MSLLNKLDELDNSLVMERQSKEQDVENLQSQLINVDTKLNTQKLLTETQAGVIKKHEEEYERLKREQNILGNKLISTKEDVQTIISENSQKMLEDINSMQTKLVDESTKRRDFEKNIERFQEALDKYTSSISIIEYKADNIDKNLE